MKRTDEKAITLLELAQQILALPPEQQSNLACYHMNDDQDFEAFEPIFGIEITDAGHAVLEGVNHSLFD